MSVNNTISQAVISPNGGLAASNTSVNNTILVGIQTGDTTTARQLGALGSQSMEAERLLSSLSGMGGHVDLKA